MRPAVQLAAGVARLAEHAAEPELAGQLRVGGIGDVVLAEVAVQPVGEVEEAVVHREDEVGDQPGTGNGQPSSGDAVDVDHRLGGPGAVRAVEAPHHARERRADEALLGVGVVLPAHLERDQPVLAEVDRLLAASASSRFQKWRRWP